MHWSVPFLFQRKSMSFVSESFSLLLFPKAYVSRFKGPILPHARSTIINSRQCHCFAFPERQAGEDESSGLLRTDCIIPFNYCSLDSVQPLIRLRCSAGPQRGTVNWGKFILTSCLDRCFVARRAMTLWNALQRRLKLNCHSTRRRPFLDWSSPLHAAAVFEFLRNIGFVRDLLHMWESITSVIYH